MNSAAIAAIPAVFVVIVFGIFFTVVIDPDRAARAKAIAEFETASTVMMSPRCMNCHRSDLPRVRDVARAHVPRVRPATDGAGRGGERCVICHRETNNRITNIPGAPDWKMPPYEMSWDGLEPGDICFNLKDKAFNGGRDLDALLKHFETSGLVQWAWKPGRTRTPPPLSYDAFLTHIRNWLSAGAPCPD